METTTTTDNPDDVRLHTLTSYDGMEPIIIEEGALDEQIQEVVVATTVPRKKQKRKQTLALRVINDEELDIQVIEETFTQEEELKVRPRREYRTKKRMEKSGKLNSNSPNNTNTNSTSKNFNNSTKNSQDLTSSNDDATTDSTTLTTRRSKRNHEMLNSNGLLSPSDLKIERDLVSHPTPERRTRLSNTCRVATGKSYKCHDCDFSTDRINNIIIHIKESCPKLSKK